MTARFLGDLWGAEGAGARRVRPAEGAEMDPEGLPRKTRTPFLHDGSAPDLCARDPVSAIDGSLKVAWKRLRRRRLGPRPLHSFWDLRAYLCSLRASWVASLQACEVVQVWIPVSRVTSATATATATATDHGNDSRRRLTATTHDDGDGNGDSTGNGDDSRQHPCGERGVGGRAVHAGGRGAGGFVSAGRCGALSSHVAVCRTRSPVSAPDSAVPTGLQVADFIGGARSARS
jgi:hypothetical protein